jgi:hypothetical protein
MVQRRELLGLGLTTDLLVIDNAMPPPEPFYLGACETLARSVPAVVVSGTGGRSFVENVSNTITREALDLPVSARTTQNVQRGALAAQPDLKQAYGAVESLVGSAEKFATFASLLGAAYPETSLDLAWRQLFEMGAPDRVGLAPMPHVYLDTLAALREAADSADAVLRNATKYIADQTDTLTTAPADMQGTGALVVFNPSSWARTDLCEAAIDFNPGAAGIALLDDAGQPVPFLADQLDRWNTRILRARIRFLARDVPSLGYRTYYVQPRGTPPEPATRPGAQIENDFFRVLVDPVSGAIVSLVAKDTGAEYAAGPLNQVLSITEDPGATDYGRELWTSEDATMVSDGPAVIEVHQTDWTQQLVITSPLAGGTVVRTITLYQGIPRVDCEMRFENVDTANRMLAAVFETNAEGCAPVFGERYGALVGRKGIARFDFRTAAGANPSGTGAQPSLCWAAVSPNDGFLIGDDISVPFGPCAIIHGNGEELEEAAEEVAKALIGRGIPASVLPDTPRILNTVWTDSTEFPDFNDDLVDGTAMRILVGSQDQNLFCRHACMPLASSAVERFNNGLKEGSVLLFMDKNVPEGHSPIPTLVLAGHAPSVSADKARAFARAVAATGSFPMSPLDFADASGPEPAKTGLAILHVGAALSSVEANGALVLFLARDTDWEAASDSVSVPSIPNPYSVRYAI